MRPVNFTVDQIIEAGKALQTAGRSITGFALRQRVGGGDANRLKQVWEEHLSGLSVRETEPVAELPVEVAQQLTNETEALVVRLNAMAVEINDRAVKASERRVSEVVRAAGEQREQAEHELADASQTVIDLEQQLDKREEENERLTSDLKKALEEKQSLDLELAKMRERLISVEKAAQLSIDNAKNQEKSLRDELKDRRNAEQMAREREAQANGALAAIEKQHLQDAEVCQVLRGEIRELGAALTIAQAEKHGQIERNAQDQQQIVDLKSELESSRQATGEAIELVYAAKQDIAVLTERLAKQQKTPIKAGLKSKNVKPE